MVYGLLTIVLFVLLDSLGARSRLGTTVEYVPCCVPKALPPQLVVHRLNQTATIHTDHRCLAPQRASASLT